jgi:predicted metal-dependent peptidase
MSSNPVDLALGLDAPPSVDEHAALMAVRTAIAHLIDHQLFYATILMNMKITTGAAAAKMVPTACVYLAEGLEFGLAVNPFFFETLSRKQQMGVLEHEVLHLVHYHLSRMPEFPQKHDFNLAADMVINQHIQADHLWIEPPPILPSLYPDLKPEPNKTVDYYYGLLNKRDEADPTGGEPPPTQGFVAGTLIHTAQGPVPIEDIKIGDQIIVWNFNTHRRFKRAVRQVQTGEPVYVAPLVDPYGAPIATCAPYVIVAAPKNNNAPYLQEGQPAIAYHRTPIPNVPPVTKVLCWDPTKGRVEAIDMQYDPANTFGPLFVPPPEDPEELARWAAQATPPSEATYSLMIDGLERNMFVGPQGILTGTQMGSGGCSVEIQGGEGPGQPGPGEGSSPGGNGEPGEGSGEGEPGSGSGGAGGTIIIKRGGAGQTPDSHERWGNTDENGRHVPEHVQEHMADELMRKGREQSQKNGSWGSLPGAFRDLVDERLKPKINWRHELKKFVGEAIRIGFKRTRKRPHRRFKYDQPGRKTLRGGDIIVIIDTSGSIGKDEIAQFRAEIDKMSTQANITVIECDAQIGAIYKWDPRKPTWKPTGGGGTSFQPPFTAIDAKEHPKDTSHLLKKRPGGIVYFTDGYADKDITFRMASGAQPIPVLWIWTTRGHEDTSPFGREIFLDITQSSSYQ